MKITISIKTLQYIFVDFVISRCNEDADLKENASRFLKLYPEFKEYFNSNALARLGGAWFGKRNEEMRAATEARKNKLFTGEYHLTIYQVDEGSKSS